MLVNSNDKIKGSFIAQMLQNGLRSYRPVQWGIHTG
jgi:hypothetical protein